MTSEPSPFPHDELVAVELLVYQARLPALPLFPYLAAELALDAAAAEELLGRSCRVALGWGKWTDHRVQLQAYQGDELLRAWVCGGMGPRWQARARSGMLAREWCAWGVSWVEADYAAGPLGLPRSGVALGLDPELRRRSYPRSLYDAVTLHRRRIAL